MLPAAAGVQYRPGAVELLAVSVQENPHNLSDPTGDTTPITPKRFPH